jgi:hypothetical protein
MRHWLRFLIALSAATGVWLVSASAFAAAPQCDERGATTFAPNPKLEEPSSSLAPVDTECAPQDRLQLNFEQNQTGSIDLEFKTTPATLPTVVSIEALPGELATCDVGALLTPSNADRERLDRPPR